MMKKITLFFLLGVTFFGALSAQSFLTPVTDFSTEKTIFITMEDGLEIGCLLKELHRENGFIKEVVIKNNDGATQVLQQKSIRSMYLYPANDQQREINQEIISSGDVNSALLKDGYVYFERADNIWVNKEQFSLLMQVLNPTFEGDVRIYYDPLSTQLQTAEAQDVSSSSYYLKDGQKDGICIRKREYSPKVFQILFSTPKDKGQKRSTVQWQDFAKHVYLYAQKV